MVKQQLNGKQHEIRTENRDTVVAQIESGIIYKLTAALHGKISITQGQAQQSNFQECPAIEVCLVNSTADPDCPPIRLG